MRLLILSADIGEGHDLPARVLAAEVRERVPDAEIEILDVLQVSGAAIRKVVREGSDVILERGPAVFDLQYQLAMRRPTRWIGDIGMPLFAGRRLRDTVAAHRADAVVATHPLASYVLGVLRRHRRLPVPVASAITDLAALRYWAHAGVDLHLITHEESAAEVREIAGAATRVAAVRGLTHPSFDQPLDPDEARRALDLPATGPVVLVSGGGWGVGDLEGAVRAGLDADPAATVVALCGRNAELRAALDGAFGRHPRARTLGFTDRMGELMAAADVLVHSTAGLTALEAMIRGARVISYGWGIAHIRINNRAYERFGLARVAVDEPSLRQALAGALAEGPSPDLGYGARPSAAELVLELAGR
ncbi:MGDG synthase family glycosyltransferase [Patulibacter defluvii]|uniref:MGDG synthase family glycosyltransferase n=1 Tax=Patulibacter defluvii TaxID=3095358 RepID=UPI002A750E76|nr:hypothetical protein [Patulibacter sp. DM4]